MKPVSPHDDGAGVASSPAQGLCSRECCESRGETEQHPYRVFISYSHENRNLAEPLAAHLRSRGLFPITDHEIRVGEAFSEEIREMIECAHVFMPLVTPSANSRLWVQQEIGYAAALHVPVCPIAVGDLPAGMTEQIQGIHIPNCDGETPGPDKVMDVVKKRLEYRTIDDLVRRARRRPRQARFDCAMHWAERQEVLVTLTDTARRQGCKLLDTPRTCDKPVKKGVWRLRQRTGFGSFSIPDVNVDSEVWRTRDLNRYHTHYERELLRRERQVMEQYMQCFGCDLIIDPRVQVRQGPVHPDDRQEPGENASSQKEDTSTTFKHSPIRTAFRLRLLASFIEGYLDNDILRVVVPPQAGSITTNLVIAGDWYASEAVVPHYRGAGYQRTMFTRHAPTVLNMIDGFEQDFQDYMGCAVGPESVRGAKDRSLNELRKWQKENEDGLPQEERNKLEETCGTLGV